MDRATPALDGFKEASFSFQGHSKRVWVSGAGPAVIVMSEMPGISPRVVRFARGVRDAGFTVWLPSLFGRDGAVPEAEAGAQVFRRACVSSEFRVLAGGGSSPVTEWLRGLSRYAHRSCGGPGVGAVGMCFTGNFALSMMLEPSMLAPVLAQPSLPLDQPERLESPAEELAQIRARLESEDLTVRAYRFAGDRFCTGGRFAAYAAALGPRFEARVLSDSSANPDVDPFFSTHVPTPHSVFTQNLVDEAGEETAAARDEVLEFLRLRLAVV